MKQKQKHADMIKAWADGEIIQYQRCPNGEWIDCANRRPSWDDAVVYRVKPEPVFEAQYTYKLRGEYCISTYTYKSLSEAVSKLSSNATEVTIFSPSLREVV